MEGSTEKGKKARAKDPVASKGKRSRTAHAVLGQHAIPFRIEAGGSLIEAVSRGGFVHYKRTTGDKVVEKRLVTGSKTLYLLPLSPVNLPKKITDYLLLELDNQIVLQPGSRTKVELRTPVEIGVFSSKDQPDSMIDVVGFDLPRYSLYGDVKGGEICRYSKVGGPDLDGNGTAWPRGTLELTITNGSGKWVTIGRVVVDTSMMDIHYDGSSVLMAGTMKVNKDLTAEVSNAKPAAPMAGKLSCSCEQKNVMGPVIRVKYKMEGGL